jgi:hypothetical protein
MANANIPLMSQRTGTPITSVGSGAGRLQDTTNLFTPNKSGGVDSALIGALAGAMIGDKTGATPLTSAANAVTGALGKATGAGGSGGGTGGTSSMPTGNIGSVASVSLPAGTSQAQVDAKYGTTNGQSNYVVAGVNSTDGSVIATPNYNIGGTNLSGLGATGATSKATAPTDQTAGTYFQDSYGNIYDGSGNLYAVNQGGSYYVNTGGDTWTNSDTYETMNTNALFGGSGGGWDPTANEYYNTEDYFSAPDTSLYEPNYDFYDTEDYFSSSDPWFKKGGLATPLMASGGKVKGYAEGDLVTAAANSMSNADASGSFVDTNSGVLDSIKSLLGGSSVQGALLGTLLSQLMSGSSSNNVYKGVDMSKVGNIAPVTTDWGMGPAKYIPYTDYMPTVSSPLSTAAENNKLYANLGAAGYTPNLTAIGGRPLGMADGGRIPTHYTFGTQVNAEDFLAEGGMPQNTNVPMTGGLSNNPNVPMLKGRHDYRKGAAVNGEGDGQSDDIPAMLADGEYVMDAEIVSALGNGSNKAGAKVLDTMRKNIREHKRTGSLNSIPPKAKSPLAYLKGAK